MIRIIFQDVYRWKNATKVFSVKGRWGFSQKFIDSEFIGRSFDEFDASFMSLVVLCAW
jgi:hypothetical protein